MQRFAHARPTCAARQCCFVQREAIVRVKLASKHSQPNEPSDVRAGSLSSSRSSTSGWKDLKYPMVAAWHACQGKTVTNQPCPRQSTIETFVNPYLSVASRRTFGYHRALNDCRCKSLIISKTISVSKKIQKYIFRTCLSKKHNVRMKLQTLQILHIFIECKNMVGGASVHISKHSLFRLKITVGCRLCAYPSIHFFVSRSRSVVDCVGVALMCVV